MSRRPRLTAERTQSMLISTCASATDAPKAQTSRSREGIGRESLRLAAVTLGDGEGWEDRGLEARSGGPVSAAMRSADQAAITASSVVG